MVEVAVALLKPWLSPSTQAARRQESLSDKWVSQARWKSLGPLLWRLCPAKLVITLEGQATAVVGDMALLVEAEEEAVEDWTGKAGPSTLVELGLTSTWKASQWSTLPSSLDQAEIPMVTGEVEEGWLSMERCRAAVNMGAKVLGAALGVTFMETASLDVFLLKYKIRFESRIFADIKSPGICNDSYRL